VDLVTVPTALDPSLTESVKFALEQELGIAVGLYTPCLLDIPVYFPAGVTQTIIVYVRKDTLALTGEPAAHILDPDTADWPTAPTPLASATAANLANTWQTLTLAYTEPTRSRTLTLRLQATHNSGNVYWAHRVLTCYQYVSHLQ
jgi:hypothetical protein